MVSEKEIIQAVKRIRDTAMEQTLAARIPESGEFGAIAQDADWLFDALSAAARVRAENDAFQDAVVTGLGAVKMNADGSAERVDLRADGRKGCQEGNSNGGQ